MTSGTTVQHHEKLYIPKLTVQDVKIELFYETGRGIVIFDNISIREAGNKPVDDIKHGSHTLETEVNLPLNKMYVMKQADYTYRLSSETSNVAKIDKGIVKPLTQGRTTIEVIDRQGNQVAKIPLNILSSEDTKKTALISEWKNIIVGDIYFDKTNSYMQLLNEKNDRNVRKFIETLSKNPTDKYLWKDLKEIENSATMTATFRRLEEIAKQTTNPASAYYQDESAIRLVKNKLEWLHLNYYNSQKDIEGTANWWDFEIGTPRAVVNILTVMYPYFSQAEINAYTKTISHFVPDPTRFRSTLVNPFKAIGGNLVDMGRVKILESILTQDDKKLREAIHALNTLFILHKENSKAEGFFEDGSYIDHTNVAYTGAYGNVLIDGLSQLVPLIQKTQYQLTEQNISTISSWIEKSFFPLIIHGELMDIARGRSISRENASSRAAALEALRGIIRISSCLPAEKKSQVNAQVKRMLSYHTKDDIFQSLSNFSDIRLLESFLKENGDVQGTAKTHLTTFHAMDKLAYYNAEKGFGFALSLHSNRTLNFEAMNNENTRGWYTGDGMVYLYNNDYHHYSKGYWPTVNPLKLPGTTEAEAARKDVTDNYLKQLTKDYNSQAKEKAGMSTLPSAFTGMMKLDDKTALATMDFKNWNRTVSAHKSWVILDDKIVFLGTDISNTSKERISTTIEQRKDNPDNPYTVYVNGKEVSLSENPSIQNNVTHILLLSKDGQNNIGYVFPVPAQLELSKTIQKGKWSDINKNSKNPAELSNEFITISQKHEQNHANYAYILLPNIGETEFLKRCSQTDVEVLRNEDGLQVIFDKTKNLYAIVNYKNGRRNIYPQLSIEKAGLYFFKKEDENFVEVSFKHLG